MSRTPELFLAAVLPILSLSGFAQPAAPVPPRSLVVNVLDRNGNAVRDLTNNNFRVKVNGHPAAILAAPYSLAPRRIIVLLDMSGSMGGEKDGKKWQIAREAVEDLLAQSPADVSIGLLTFSDQVHDVFAFSQGRSTISRWLREGASQRPNVRGHTALRDAIQASLRMLEPFHPGDAVYAITDGGDNASHVSVDKTTTALRESGVRLFAFLFAERIPMEEELGGDSLVQMASDSGGFVFGISGRRVMGGAYLLPTWDAEYDYDART